MTKNKSKCQIPLSSKDYKKHWNLAYLNNSTEKLGWFEKISRQTLDLINETELAKEAKILNIGVGSSTLIDNLLEEGFTNIIANDFADISLNFLKKRIGKNDRVQYLSLIHI